jgi:putative membrane protein
MTVGLWCAQTGTGGWIAMIALWLAVVGLIVWGLSRLFPTRPEEDARTLLDARLAAGKVDLQTYQGIRAELDRPTRVSIRVPR